MKLTRKDLINLYPKLFAFAVSLSRDKTIAEDLVNDTFVKIMEKLEDQLELKDLTAWSITVLRNQFLDRIRKKSELQLDLESNEEANLQDTSLGVDPFSQIIFSECWGKLTDNYQEVLRFSIFDGLTSKDIGQILDRPQNTVLTWLTKAKLQFHACLSNQNRVRYEIRIFRRGTSAFYFGELSKPRTDDLIELLNSSKGDYANMRSKALKRLDELRSIDELLQNSAEAAYPIPVDLENRINDAFLKLNKKQSKHGLLARFVGLFSLENAIPAFGGAVTASVCFVLVLQFNQPTNTLSLEQSLDLVFEEPKQMRSENIMTATKDRLSRNTALPENKYQSSDYKKQSFNERWQLNENFAVQIHVFSHAGATVDVTAGVVMEESGDLILKVLPLEDSLTRVNVTLGDLKLTAIEATEFVKGHVVSIKLGSIEEIKKDADNSKFGMPPPCKERLSFCQMTKHHTSCRFQLGNRSYDSQVP